MGFLRLLAAGRTAVLDGFFSGLTYFGSELAFMAAALLMFWCIDKRQGYYVFLVGAFGTICNQFLKLAFRIPRPWVLDPEFQIVEAARADATGYSFPSGHTQNIVGTTASLFACRKEKWVRIVCAVLMVLVPFSRMYLGVHTPLDVGVSFVLALALAAALYPAFRTEQTAKKATPWILLGAAALGDIGKLFPDSADEFAGISSLELLRRVKLHLAAAGYDVVNIDATILAQAPKLAPYREQMRANIARELQIDVSRVSVKATTEEHLGFTGSGEGMAAHAIALLERADN